jgi:hypothetical protein
MSTNHKLQEIWKTYCVIKDTFKIATRSVEQRNVDLLKQTDFINQEIDVVRHDIIKSRNAADDYVILSLWSVFERIVLDTVLLESNKILDKTPSAFNKSVHAKITDAIEYLKIVDLLDLLKPFVDSIEDGELIGKAKHIKKHRDWLAHRNPKKPSPGKVQPLYAYNVLSQIVNKLETNNSMLQLAVKNGK